VAARAHTVQSVHKCVAQAEPPLYKDSCKVANPLLWGEGGGLHVFIISEGLLVHFLLLNAEHRKKHLLSVVLENSLVR
jgi:hypothetical protein